MHLHERSGFTILFYTLVLHRQMAFVGAPLPPPRNPWWSCHQTVSYQQHFGRILRNMNHTARVGYCSLPRNSSFGYPSPRGVVRRNLQMLTASSRTCRHLSLFSVYTPRNTYTPTLADTYHSSSRHSYLLHKNPVHCR